MRNRTKRWTTTTTTATTTATTTTMTTTQVISWSLAVGRRQKSELCSIAKNRFVHCQKGQWGLCFKKWGWVTSLVETNLLRNFDIHWEVMRIFAAKLAFLTLTKLINYLRLWGKLLIKFLAKSNTQFSIASHPLTLTRLLRESSIIIRLDLR